MLEEEEPVFQRDQEDFCGNKSSGSFNGFFIKETITDKLPHRL